LAFKFRVLRLESIRDVFKENQAKDDVLVLSRVHVVPEGVSRGPELRFKTERRASSQVGDLSISCSESRRKCITTLKSILPKKGSLDSQVITALHVGLAARIASHVLMDGHPMLRPNVGNKLVVTNGGSLAASIRICSVCSGCLGKSGRNTTVYRTLG